MVYLCNKKILKMSVFFIYKGMFYKLILDLILLGVLIRMKDRIVRKSMVFCIIILFLLVNIYPSSSSSECKILRRNEYFSPDKQ